MVVDDTSVAPAAPAPARVRGIAIARALMALAWLAWAILAWWSAPRAATHNQLTADLANGRIDSFSTAVSWVWPNYWGAPASTRFIGENGRILVWNNNNGQTYYLTVDNVERVDLPTRTIDGVIFPIGELSRELTEAGIPYGQNNLTQITAPLGLLMAVIAIIVLLGGPAPQRGTRWFWFWAGQIPFGLGYLAWLARETPWTTPPTVAKRRSGWLGIGLLILSGIIAGALVAAARALLGNWAIPG